MIYVFAFIISALAGAVGAHYISCAKGNKWLIPAFLILAAISFLSFIC